jgi:Gylcosyl hydrolase family 115 C-terminal domain
MMDQTHLGYTSWDQPPVNVMPEVREVQVSNGLQMGIAVEGSVLPWQTGLHDESHLAFDNFNRQPQYIDVFNHGKAHFDFSATTSASWIIVSPARGAVTKDQRLWVTIDWDKAPSGSPTGYVFLDHADGQTANVPIALFNPQQPTRSSLHGFVEGDGDVSIEAEHYTKKVDTPQASWQKIDDYGRTLSSMTIFPVTAKSVTPATDSPCLEYQIYLFHPGNLEVETILAPTLNFVPGRGLRFAISFDDQPPQIIDALANNSQQEWARSVEDSVRKVKSTHTVEGIGYHTLKVWMVDPGVVLQKLVIDLGGVKPSYLGPPESFHNP